MSPKKNKDLVIRAKVAKSLELLAEILTKERIVDDISPLQRAAHNCRRYPKDGKWGYSVENLIFRRLGNLRVFQEGFDIRHATLQFSVIVEGLCEIPERNDPLTLLELNIDLFGSYEGESNIEEASTAWHLDKHIYEDPSEFVHPVYHISFGGKHLESKINNKNNPVLLIDSPRIAHPPLDAVLGIDFVITNFLGTSITSFRKNNGTYINIVGEMQKCIWKPYIDTLHGFWQENSHTLPWSPNLVWPQLQVT